MTSRIITLWVASLLLVSTSQASVKTDVPVKIYILAGQSNMQGKGGIEGDGEGTLRYVVNNDPDKEFQFVVDSEGEWIVRDDVWAHRDAGPGQITYGGLKPGYGGHSGQVGPELGFGHVMGDAEDGQVLVIKAAWGGKSLGHDFLPPSVGKYEKPERPGHPGFYYHEILRIVKDVTENIRTYFPDYRGQGVEIAGICWHQGWNDQYGGLDAKYESNLVDFIKDIRSAEHGLGVPGLPIAIATSGMIKPDSPVVQGQIAMGDTEKYPQFKGNVSVVDTHQPYGPKKMEFKFYTKSSPDSVGYHWNNHARSYVNIGRALAEEMKTITKPPLPSRLRAYGISEGVALTWQLGAEKIKSIELSRNGKKLDVDLSPTQSAFVDTTALPGKNDYELSIKMSKSPKQVMTISTDTSVIDLKAHRSVDGAVLRWSARGKYEGFKVMRDGKVIADSVPGDAREYEDKDAPEQGMVKYAVQPTTGNATPAELTVNRGPIDPGGALVYEPFDYPASATNFLSIVGKSGAVGTRGEYFIVKDSKPDRMPATVAGGLSYGSLPVTGNRVACHRWSAGAAIELDDSLRKAGLLEDGATMWISWVFCISKPLEHRQGGGMFTLASKDYQEGVGLKATGSQSETITVRDGKVKGVRIGAIRKNIPTLVVGKIVWGKNGENDLFVPYRPGFDLKQPEKHCRSHSRINPFNIDQTKLELLHLQSEGVFDEIRVGPTYESVIGGGTRTEEK